MNISFQAAQSQSQCMMNISPVKRGKSEGDTAEMEVSLSQAPPPEGTVDAGPSVLAPRIAAPYHADGTRNCPMDLTISDSILNSDSPAEVTIDAAESPSTNTAGATSARKAQRKRSNDKITRNASAAKRRK